MKFLFLLICVFGLAKEKPSNHEGYKIVQMEKNGLFAKLGLQKNDVVLQLNDKKIHSKNTVQDLTTALEKENSIRLLILRENKELTLTYDIK